MKRDQQKRHTTYAKRPTKKKRATDVLKEGGMSRIPRLSTGTHTT